MAGPIVITVICALLIFLGWRDPQYRSLAIGATGVLIFLAGAIAWQFLIYAGIVSLDRYFGPHWQYTLTGVKQYLVFFGPPAAATALIFLLFGKSITPPTGDGA
jgi:hypothetical protein